MNKKGFTLVELLVSIAILTVSMVFISAFLLKLMEQKDDNAFDTDAMVNQAAISKTINYDVVSRGINDDVNLSEGFTSEGETKYKTISYSFINKENGDTANISIKKDGKTIEYEIDNTLIFARTLSNSLYTNITFETEILNSGKIFTKIVIFNDKGYNIEIYDYK